MDLLVSKYNHWPFQFYQDITVKRIFKRRSYNKQTTSSANTRYKTFCRLFLFISLRIFHLGYMVFLIGVVLAGKFIEISGLTGTFIEKYGNAPSLVELKNVFLTALIFFLNHLFSYLYNRPKDTKKQNIGSLMFYPYARIIPMHLTIIFGPACNLSLPLFLLLKTIADVIMHSVEHNVLRKGELQEV